MNEIIAQRQQAERQDRIDKILNTARKLFFRKGYLNTTVRDIALKAHFSTGVIYFYFKGKGDIYGRICEEGYHIMIGLTKEAAQVQGTSLDKLVAVWRAYYRFYTEYKEYHDIINFSNVGFRRVGLPAETVIRLEELSTQALLIANEVVVEGIKEGVIDYQGDSLELTLLGWASIQGLISILERGYLGKYKLDFVKLRDIQIELLKSIVTQPNLHSIAKS